MADLFNNLQMSDIRKIFEENQRKNFLSYQDAQKVALYDFKNSLAYSSSEFHLFLNAVYMWKLSEAGLDQDLHELFTPFRASEKSLRFIAGSDINDKKLKKALLMRGFIHAEDTISMALDLNKLPTSHKDNLSLDIIKVTSRDDLLKWLEPLEDVYKLRGSVRDCTLDLYGDLAFSDKAKWCHFVACHEGKPVSSLSLFHDSPYITIYNLATSLQAQRKGFGKGLILKALGEVNIEEYQVCLVQSSQKAKNTLKKLGFLEYFSQGLYLYMPWPKVERKKINMFGRKRGKKNAD